MVRRNPKGIASFSNSLISVVAGISGTPSIPRAHLAPTSTHLDAHAPTMEEREIFFSDSEIPAFEAIRPSLSHELSVDTASEIVSSDPVEVSSVEAVEQGVIEVNQVTTDSLVEESEVTPEQDIVAEIETAHSAPEATVLEDEEVSGDVAHQEAIDSSPVSIESESAEVIAEIEEPVAVDEMQQETTTDDNVADASLGAESSEMVADRTPDSLVVEAEELEIPEAGAEEAVEEQVDSPSVVAEAETETENEQEQEHIAAAEPIVESADVTENVVRAVLKQFEEKSGTVPDSDMIRSITEQVASQMAAQQTAMRIAQQVLSNQTAVPMPVPGVVQPVAGVPVQGVAVPGVVQPVAGVPVQGVAVPGVVEPVAGIAAQPVAGVPGEPISIPGFDPSAYLGTPAPVQYQQGPGVVMPAPVQYQQTPVWTPPAADTPVPMPMRIESSQPQYVVNIQAPAAPQYQGSAPISAPVERVTPTFAPPTDEVTAPQEPQLPTIEAFDPSAYLGMNAVPSLQPVAEDAVEEEPTWEPIYEFAPIEESGSLSEESEEEIRMREVRRAQQMLRELSALRDQRQ